MYFPREILPLTYIAAALFDWCVGAVVLAALLAYYDHAVTWSALYGLPIVVLLAGLVTGAGLLLSALQVRFRDVGLAMPLMIQVWLFATPVFTRSPPSLRALLWVFLNPMTGVVESFRAAVIHRGPDPRARGAARSSRSCCRSPTRSSSAPKRQWRM